MIILANNSYNKFSENYEELDLLLCYLDYNDDSIKEIFMIDKIFGSGDFKHKNVYVTSSVRNDLIAFQYIRYHGDNPNKNSSKNLNCSNKIFIWNVKDKKNEYEIIDDESLGLQICPIYFSSFEGEYNCLTQLRLKKSQTNDQLVKDNNIIVYKNLNYYNFKNIENCQEFLKIKRFIKTNYYNARVVYEKLIGEGHKFYYEHKEIVLEESLKRENNKNRKDDEKKVNNISKIDRKYFEILMDEKDFVLLQNI